MGYSFGVQFEGVANARNVIRHLSIIVVLISDIWIGEKSVILEAEKIRMCEATEEDFLGILEVYNSNQDFLLSHMGRSDVSAEWLEKEQKEMKEMKFKTLIVKENTNENLIGFIDIRPIEECYLSLLMVHKLYRGKGYGKEIYEKLENYLLNQHSKTIRIDVVYDNNKEILGFWENRGFKKIEKIQFKWSNTLLDAVVMKKNL